MNNQLFHAVGAAAVLSFLLQWLKQSSWFPWINAQSEKINRWLAVAGSGLASLGIHVVCSQVNHQCTIGWVSGAAIANGLWHWLVQFAIVHGWYKATR